MRATRLGTRGYKSVNPLYAHDDPNQYADYSGEASGHTWAWKALCTTAAAVFVYENTYDTTRPTQTHLLILGHGAPI